MLKKVMFIGCVCLSGIVFADGEYRIFSDGNGRTVEAKIIKYDADKEVVRIESREDRSRYNVQTGYFSDEDQNYIRDWGLIQAFMSESKFKVSAEKKSHDKEKKEGIIAKKSVQPVSYEVKLQNCSGRPLPKMRLEYCLLWEQEQDIKDKSKKGTQSRDKEKVLMSRKGRADIEPFEKETVLKTDVAELKFRRRAGAGELVYSSGGLPKSLSAYMKGILVKIHMTTPGGQTVAREYCYPSDLSKKYSWDSVK